MNYKLFLRQAKLVLEKNAPAILTGMASAGVVATGIFSVKAGMEAQKSISDREAADSPVADKIKMTWKLYLPPAAVGISTIGCILALHSTHTNRYAAAISAYSVVDKALTEYREEVQSLYGEAKAKKVDEAVGERHISENPIETTQVLVTGLGEHLCYDSLSGRYFKSDIEAVRKAQNDVNSQILNEQYASLNDFYRCVGLPTTGHGDEVGWNASKLLEVVFSSHLAENGEPCLAIDYIVAPTPKYYKMG